MKSLKRTIELQDSDQIPIRVTSEYTDLSNSITCSATFIDTGIIKNLLFKIKIM